MKKIKTQDKLAERKFFNKFGNKQGYEVFDEKGYQKIIGVLKHAARSKNNQIIVDMGCGSGAFTVRLKKTFPQSKIVGLDISDGCIRAARKNIKGVKFIIGDVESTKIKSGSVDVLCYSGILHHFPDFSKVAKEAQRVLKRGGIFFSYDPNLYNPAFWLYRDKKSPFYSPVGVTKNERLLKSGEIKSVFKNTGFEVKTKIISGLSYSYIESKKAMRIIKLYNSFDKILGATPAADFIGAFIIAWGKKK